MGAEWGLGGKHRREWQIGRQGTDLVVNVTCYIRLGSLAAESLGLKKRKRETLLDRWFLNVGDFSSGELQND